MREKSSTGPLAKGLSILVFSHGSVARGGQTGLPANFRQRAPETHGSLVSPRCLVKSKYLLHAIRLIRAATRPRRILVWDRWRFLGYFRQLPHHIGGG